jgi:hypothetical protein
LQSLNLASGRDACADASLPHHPTNTSRSQHGTRVAGLRCSTNVTCKRPEQSMRPVLLWILGIPIPIIILLYLFNVL